MTTLIKDKMLLLGKDEESIVHTVRTVLKEANVVAMKIDARVGMVDFWRLPTEEESNDELVNPFREVLRRVTMEEYVPENSATPYQQFFAMCEILEDAGCFPVFLLSSRPHMELRKWIPFPRKSSLLGGVPIKVVDEIGKDTLLLCGAPIKDAEPIDVSFIVKMTIP